MRKSSLILISAVLFLWGCSATKGLEVTVPFTLGETYAQKWAIEDQPVTGYEVIIPILSLNNNEAVLKNLYHKGKMTSVEIKLTQIGNVAIAEFGSHSDGKDTANMGSIKTDDKPFPFELTGTQAVISYVNNKKVKYYLINGIRQNLAVSYPTVSAKNEW